MTVVGGALRQTGDDTLDVQTDEVVDDTHFSITLLMGVGTDDAIAALGSLLLDTIEHGSIVMGDEIGHDDSNHPRSLFAKTLCKGVGAVVQTACQFLHALLHFLSYLR